MSEPSPDAGDDEPGVTLHERIDRIEAELDRLQSDLGQFEFRGNPEDPGAEQLQDLYYAEFPLGRYLLSRLSEEDLATSELAKRVHDLENGRVDPADVVGAQGGLDIEELLPLHQKYLAATTLDPQDNGLTANQEIAARLFPHLAATAVNTGYGKLVLTSSEIGDLITTEVATPELASRLDVADPNPNTVRRVIGFIDQFTPSWFELNTDASPTRLLIDRDCWVEYTETITNLAEDTDSTSDDPYTVVNPSRRTM